MLSSESLWKTLRSSMMVEMPAGISTADLVRLPSFFFLELRSFTINSSLCKMRLFALTDFDCGEIEPVSLLILFADAIRVLLNPPRSF